MSDPRKPIRRPDAAQSAATLEIARKHLLACTAAGTREIGCTGGSFVIIGIGVWVGESAELDPRATAQMLRALADLSDPSSSEGKKISAERKRRAAVNKLLGALDLYMAAPQGKS